VIPLRDSQPPERLPVVNSLLLLINAAVFAYELRLGPGLADTLNARGLVPARLLAPEAWAALGPIDQLTPLVSHMFLHAGWLHVGGNLLFLFIFGKSVEGRLGHLRYLLFYLGAGLAGASVQIISGPSSLVPVIGASGAIAGILGAYLLLFPRAKVLTLVPVLFFATFIEIPAFILLGLWALLQVLGGTAALSAEPMGGVAWWAHVGGFGAGVATVLLNPGLRRPVRPHPRFRRRRYPGGR